MKAMLLAAGYGSRLGEITAKKPKCMVNVGGQPILGHWLNKLDQLGVNKFYINTHYLSEQVEEYVCRHPLRGKIETLHEDRLLGTAGSLNRHRHLFDEVTFVVHVDNYCHDNLNGLVDTFHSRPAEALMSFLVFKSSSPSTCGVVTTYKNGLMSGFYEKQKKPPSNIASGAVFLCSKQFFNFFDAIFESQTDFSAEIMPLMKKKANCYKTNSFFIDIGTPKNLQLAEQFSAFQNESFM